MSHWPADTRPIAFASIAEDYASAAETLNGPREFGGKVLVRPMYQLVGISLETAMKGALIFQGVPVEDLKRKYGHNLTKLLDDLDGKICKPAESKALNIWKTEVKRFRDSYADRFGSLRDAVEKEGDIPSNAEVGAAMPKVSRLICELDKCYRQQDSLRYFGNEFPPWQPLSFRPFIDTNVLLLTKFSYYLCGELEELIRKQARKKS